MKLKFLMHLLKCCDNRGGFLFGKYPFAKGCYLKIVTLAEAEM